MDKVVPGGVGLGDGVAEGPDGEGASVELGNVGLEVTGDGVPVAGDTVVEALKNRQYWGIILYIASGLLTQLSLV